MYATRDGLGKTVILVCEENVSHIIGYIAMLNYDRIWVKDSFD